MRSELIVFLICLFAFVQCRLPNGYGWTRSNEPTAFMLARLQRDYDADYDEDGGDQDPSDHKSFVDGVRRRDEVMNDAKCLQKCNNQLNIGMDMAHMAFGSIDVPSVMEKRDLELFCMLDYQHSQCIDECGYSVQFNLREYVCRNRYGEMLRHLPCYAKSAPSLIRHCRPRCGGYKPLSHTQEGYNQRCRQLLCDHTCTSFILKRVCPDRIGINAAEYLLDFTRLQVDYWMKDYTKQGNRAPISCRKLQCDDFKLSNCRRKHKRVVHSSSDI